MSPWIPSKKKLHLFLSQKKKRFTLSSFWRIKKKKIKDNQGLMKVRKWRSTIIVIIKKKPRGCVSFSARVFKGSYFFLKKIISLGQGYLQSRVSVSGFFHISFLFSYEISFRRNKDSHGLLSRATRGKRKSSWFTDLIPVMGFFHSGECKVFGIGEGCKRKFSKIRKFSLSPSWKPVLDTNLPEKILVRLSKKAGLGLFFTEEYDSSF